MDILGMKKCSYFGKMDSFSNPSNRFQNLYRFTSLCFDSDCALKWNSRRGPLNLGMLWSCTIKLLHASRRTLCSCSYSCKGCGRGVWGCRNTSYLSLKILTRRTPQRMAGASSIPSYLRPLRIGQRAAIHEEVRVAEGMWSCYDDIRSRAEFIGQTQLTIWQRDAPLTVIGDLRPCWNYPSEVQSELGGSSSPQAKVEANRWKRLLCFRSDQVWNRSEVFIWGQSMLG